MARTQPEPTDWNAFGGRALGFLCLHAADLQKKTVLERADFLMGLGLPRREAAVVLGTSDESLRELARQRDKRTGGPRKGRATVRGAR